MKNLTDEYKIELSLAVVLLLIPVLLTFKQNITLEWKVLSFIIGSFSIIPLMFIFYTEKYKSYYIENILNYQGGSSLIFEFLRLTLKSYKINQNDSIECSICLQDKLVINLLRKNEIKQWHSIDSMGEEFWKTNKDNQFFNTILENSLGQNNINRFYDKNKKYDFAIATLQDDSKIVFSEILEADTRSAKILFNKEDIYNYENKLESILKAKGVG